VHIHARIAVVHADATLQCVSVMQCKRSSILLLIHAIIVPSAPAASKKLRYLLASLLIEAYILLCITFNLLLPCLHTLGMLKVPLHSGSVDVRLPCAYDNSSSLSSDNSSCNLYMRLVHSQYNSIASNFVVDYATQHLYTDYRPSARLSLVQEERAMQMLAIATRCIQFIVQVKHTHILCII
jgi:hypothetical protein